MEAFGTGRTKKAKPDNVPALLAEAEACIRRREFAQAVSLFDAALAHDPRSAPAFTGKGIALQNMGKNREALDSFSRALSLTHSPDETWHVERTDSIPQKTHEETLHHPAAAPTKDILGADAWYDKALTYGSAGDYRKADESFDRVLEIDPGHADAWFNKGRVLGLLGAFQRAIGAFDRALELRPFNADAWYYRGVSCIRLRKLPEAYTCFEKALQIDPRHRKALDGLRDLAEIMKQFKKS